MKSIIITLLAAAMIISLFACGSGEKAADANNNPDVSSSADSSQEIEEAKVGLRDELMTYRFEINGTALTIPFDYSEITALGYELTEDDELAPNTYTIGTYVKNADGDSLHVQFWNGSTEPKQYSECQICQVEIKLDEHLDVKLPGDLKFDENLTPEQVIAAYGEADFDLDQESYRSLTYDDGGFKQVDFMFYKEDNMKGYSTLTINHIED